MSNRWHHLLVGADDEARLPDGPANLARLEHGRRDQGAHVSERPTGTCSSRPRFMSSTLLPDPLACAPRRHGQQPTRRGPETAA